MTKVKTEDSQPEKIKITVKKGHIEPPKNTASYGTANKTKDSTWNHLDLDGGFAEEMKHSPGETVLPVDLSAPEPPSKRPLGPKPEPEAIRAPEGPPVEPEEAVPKPEEKPSEASENEPDKTDAVYKSDEDFYSSKLDAGKTHKRVHKNTKPRSHPGKYLNARFIFILCLFMTTLVAGVIMLVILEQQQPGSSMIFDYLPLPDFQFELPPQYGF